MSEATYTPLPWRVIREDGKIAIGTDEHEPWFIADMTEGARDIGDPEPIEANAALIVTAVNTHPALLARVAELEAALQDIADGLPSVRAVARYGEMRRVAAAALAALSTTNGGTAA